MKLYGNLTNRIEENQNYNQDKLIHEGDDITMYYWSDRHCYFVTRVIDQKHIFVKQYEVCANQEKDCGMGHQDWMYFKTRKEYNEYIRKFYPERTIVTNENSEQEWVFRYGKWMQAIRYNLEGYQRALEEARKDCSHPEDEECVKRVARFYFRVSDSELEKILAGKEVIKYMKMQPVSFGVRDYYYDWEF